MLSQLKPHICIISGPVAKRDRIVGALTAEGLPPYEVEGHGLPSYPDPLAAAEAGAPNSGHTPDTPHPEELHYIVQPGEHAADDDHPCTDEDCDHVGGTEPRPNPLGEHIGSAYEDDPSIGFLAVQCENPDRVSKTLGDSGWMLRMYIPPAKENLEEMISPDDRLARIERDIAILRGEHQS